MADALPMIASELAPWCEPVDPAGVRRAYAALLVEDLPTMLAATRRLLAPHVVVEPSARDRAALRSAGGPPQPAGPLPADPFGRPGPWHAVPNWPRPLVWDAVNLHLDAHFRAFAFDAVETLVAEVRRLDLAPAHEVRPELTLALVRARQHRLDEAQALARQVLATRADLPPTRRAMAMHVLGYVATLQGRGWEGRDLQRECLALARVAGDTWSENSSLAILGQCELHSFDLAEAVRLLASARRLLLRSGQRTHAWQATMNLAVAQYKQGRPTVALRLADRIEERQRRAGQLQGWLLTRLVRAKALMVKGDGPGAAAVATSVLPVADRYGWARERILALEVLGEAAFAAGRGEEAAGHWRESRRLAAERAPRGDLVVGLDRRLAQVELAGGRPAVAADLLAPIRDRAARAGEIFEEVVSGRLLATSLRQCGRPEPARDAIRDAIARARFHGAQLELARALVEGARIQADLVADDASCESAWAFASEARDLLASLGEFPAELAACETFLAALRDRWRASLVWSAPLRGHRAPTRMAGPGDAAGDGTDDDFVAGAPSMHRVAQLIALAASADDPVLLTGETGTGKEVAAARIHGLGGRREAPLVAVNCAAIPATVFEREFFGHARGAFTGADREAAGLVERADGGTLLLDEVGELPPELQAKLLRLLQEGTYRRLGEPRERRADLRVIAATNADLLSLVADGRFRQDLYFRLQVLEIHLPPLRDRGDDVLVLARRAARAALGPDADAPAILGPALWAALPRYAWPGNVRELVGLVRRACLYHRARRPLPPDALPRALRTLLAAGAEPPPSPAVAPLATHLALAERDAIARALAATGGRRAAAAHLLGISRKCLYEKMKRAADAIPTPASVTVDPAAGIPEIPPAAAAGTADPPPSAAGPPP